MPDFFGTWSVIADQPVAPRAMAMARKLVGSMLEVGGIPKKRIVMDDGTVIHALIVNGVPKVTIEVGGGSTEDDCIGLAGILRGPFAISNWPDVTPREGLAPHKLSYFNMTSVYDEVLFWGNQASLVDGSTPPDTVFKYDHAHRTVVATSNTASSGTYYPGIPWSYKGNKHRFRSGYSPSPKLDAGTTAPYYPVAWQYSENFDIEQGTLSYSFLSEADAVTPNELDRVFGSAAGRVAAPGLNTNGALKRDASIILPDIALGFGADDGVSSALFIEYSSYNPNAAWSNAGSNGAVINLGTETPYYPTVVAQYKNRLDAYGFLPLTRPTGSSKRGAQPALGQLASFEPVSLLLNMSSTIQYGADRTPSGLNVSGTSHGTDPLFASQYCCTAQVCASVATAGIWDFAGNPSGDVVLHEVGKTDMRVIGHIPELDNIYAVGIARAVPLHDRVLVFVPTVRKERSGDTTPHPWTLVESMSVYEIT